MRTVLVCSAIAAEQESLAGAGNSAFSLESFLCGIGNVAAAGNLTERLCTGELPSEIVFVGSAGTYARDSGAFRIGVSRVFAQRELSVLRGESRKPDLLTQKIETTPGLFSEILANKLDPIHGITNCPDSITLIDAPELFSGMDFENMECFGLAHCALRFKIPFTAFFALTNSVGPDGSREWFRNYNEFSQELQRRILGCL